MPAVGRPETWHSWFTAVELGGGTDAVTTTWRASIVSSRNEKQAGGILAPKSGTSALLQPVGVGAP